VANPSHGRGNRRFGHGSLVTSDGLDAHGTAVEFDHPHSRKDRVLLGVHARTDDQRHRRHDCPSDAADCKRENALSAPTTGVRQAGGATYLLRRTRANRIAVTNATTNAGRATMTGHIASDNTRMREC